jgi:hypothetical protein
LEGRPFLIGRGASFCCAGVSLVTSLCRGLLSLLAVRGSSGRGDGYRALMIPS